MKIIPDKNYADLKRMIEIELNSRMEAVKRKIVQSVVQNTLAGVQKRAPRDIEGMEHYARDLSYRRIKSKKEPGSAIVYVGKPEEAATKNPRTTALYIRDMAEGKGGKWGEIFSILREYEPFSLYTWPAKIPKDKAFVVYRLTSDREVERIKEKNITDSDEISLRIVRAGINLKQSDFMVPLKGQFEVMRDASYTILRVEYGVGGEKHRPHWRPALKEVKREGQIKNIVSSPDIQKTVSDPRFQGWRNMGMEGEEISPQSLVHTKTFQEKLKGE